MIRQNYKVNRKTKEEADKTQVNYRSSDSDPISIIKRVYIYITDKKGNIIPEVTITIDGTEIKTGYHGLLVSNFPNEEKSITASKEGYKPATASIILNAEIQTHEFYLALTTDDDESTVISTDNTQAEDDELILCDTLFELNDNNTLVSWGVNVTNEIVDGVYTGRGSYIEQGWSNEGLWQIDYDIKYNTASSSHMSYYVGVMPFCSAEINPYTDEKRKNYCMESWEKWAAIEGLDAILIEGPSDYKYSNQNEYHHATLKKVASDKIEYYFDNNKWIYSVPKLQNLETLHFGYRDNPSSRKTGVTISTKNLIVKKLCPKTNSTEEETEEENWLNERDYVSITFKNENNDLLTGMEAYNILIRPSSPGLTSGDSIFDSNNNGLGFSYIETEQKMYIFFDDDAVIVKNLEDFQESFNYKHILVTAFDDKITITPIINGVEGEIQEFTAENVQCKPLPNGNNKEIEFEYIVPDDIIPNWNTGTQEEGTNTNNTEEEIEENIIDEPANYTEYHGYMKYIKNETLSPTIEIRALVDENSENLIIERVIDLAPITISPTELSNNVITGTIIPITPDEDPNYTFKGYHPSDNNIEYKFYNFEIPIELTH